MMTSIQNLSDNQHKETQRERARRGSNASAISVASLDTWLSQRKITKRSGLREFVQSQVVIRDGSEVFTFGTIMSACLVAACCGIAAFCLHLAVRFAGCLSGINGCHSSLLLNQLESFGISKSVYFITLSAFSGLICSSIIHSSLAGGAAKQCKGGGTAGTKIIVSAGKKASGWIPFLRIILTALYMAGGNTLGTEGPIIHLSTALATVLTGLSGAHRRKTLSTFGVIGAAAGISAGFNVLITGFIYVIEELSRTLSRKVALILTLASAVAIYVKDFLEQILHQWYHGEHASLMPDRAIWAELTKGDISKCLLLSIPIGLLNGVAGWVFTRVAYQTQNFLNDHSKGNSKIYLPERFHLAVIGLITGCLGAIAYEVTAVNGVWGTTIDAIPEVIRTKSAWHEVLLLFVMKFFSFVLATAGGGPGGLLVPSLVAGGFMGITVGLLAGGSEAVVSACAVIGMGSLFSSVLHLPVSGVIIVFELTRAEALVVHVVIANFISSNVAVRLPGGALSFVHLNLEHDPTWLKLGGQDFIETDDQEYKADSTIGHYRLYEMNTWALKDFFMTERQRLEKFFSQWASFVVMLNDSRQHVHIQNITNVTDQFGEVKKCTGVIKIRVDDWETPSRKLYLHRVWSSWRSVYIRSSRSFLRALRRQQQRFFECQETDILWPKLLEDVVDVSVPQGKAPTISRHSQGDPGLRPSFCENVFESRKGQHKRSLSTASPCFVLPGPPDANSIQNKKHEADNAWSHQELVSVANLEIGLQRLERNQDLVAEWATVGTEAISV